jgi:hypothetical protein
MCQTLVHQKLKNHGINFGNNMLTKKQEKEIVRLLIENGEIDLGFCKIIKKQINGGRGKSHGTTFKIGKFYKLGVIMSKEFKALINK